MIELETDGMLRNLAAKNRELEVRVAELEAALVKTTITTKDNLSFVVNGEIECVTDSAGYTWVRHKS